MNCSCLDDELAGTFSNLGSLSMFAHYDKACHLCGSQHSDSEVKASKLQERTDIKDGALSGFSSMFEWLNRKVVK